MQEYPIKRGLTKDLETRIIAELRTCFGVEPEKNATGYRIKSGALKRLDVTVGADGKSVIIDTESDMSASDDVIIDTNKRFRKYLDAIYRVLHKGTCETGKESGRALVLP